MRNKIMKTANKESRVIAISEKTCVLPKVCICCQTKIKHGKMWTISVGPEQLAQKKPYLCQSCAPKPTDVLHKILNHGIVGINC